MNLLRYRLPRWVEAVSARRRRTPKLSSLASGPLLAVVDTGPLYAAVDADDVDHARCIAAMSRPGLRLVVPAMVVAEATYLIGTRMGPRTEAAFLRSLRSVRIEAPRAADLDRMGDLVEQYGDFPLGGTDAAVIALAERLGTDLVLSLDRRHMLAVRLKSGGSLQVFPE